MFVGITGVQLVTTTTQKVYYAGRLYVPSYLRFPASPLFCSSYSSAPDRFAPLKISASVGLSPFHRVSCKSYGASVDGASVDGASVDGAAVEGASDEQLAANNINPTTNGTLIRLIRPDPRP